MPIYQLKREGIDKTFLFIHVPKTGGTAIENYFSAVGLLSFYDPASYRPIRPFLKVPPAHFDYDVCDRLFRLDGMYSFAIVRNPVQRMISEYRWAIEKSTLPDSVKKYSFSDFIAFAFDRYGKDMDFLAGHLKPQRLFVGNKVSKVFRYETGLNSIVTEVFKDLGLKPGGRIEVPILNKSGSLPVKITEADLAAIRNMYADDFALFGYSVELPEQAATQQGQVP